MLTHSSTPAGNVPSTSLEGVCRQKLTIQNLTGWLNTQNFTHFVTLATNEPDLRSANRKVIAGLQGADRMTALAKRWDAQMNRLLVGPRWSQPSRRADRMFASYFLEKPLTNPHWHVLIRIDDDDFDRRTRKIEKLHDRTEEIWLEIITSGSTAVRTIHDGGAANYVAKELQHQLSYEHFIIPDMFGMVEP